MRRIFVHPEEGRLRAPWRLLVHALACVGVGVLTGLLFARASGPRAFELAWSVQLLALAAATFALGRLVDRRRGWPRALGLDPRGALELGAGTSLGAGLIGGVALVESATGSSSIVLAPGPIDVVGLAISGLLFVSIAISEESIFRAYHLTNLAEGLSSARLPRPRAALVALAISSVVFGLAHAANPGATPVAVANVALAGVLLGAPFVRTGRLGVSIGLHVGWNAAQALLDMPVSGQEVGVALFVRSDVGATWLTGGEFGPEGGALGTVAVLVGIPAAVGIAEALAQRRGKGAGIGTGAGAGAGTETGAGSGAGTETGAGSSGDG